VTGTRKREERIDGVRIIRIPVGKKLFFKKFLIWKWMLQNIPFFGSFDVIHVHDVFFWLFPIRPFFFWKKMYITFHGYEDFPVKKRWIFIRKMTEILTNGSICIGKFMKKWYFASPTYINYGGVRLEERNSSENDMGAVFFGRLENQTGIMQYLEAFEKIKKEYPYFKLTVVGEGPLKRQLPKNINYKPFTTDVLSYIAKNRFIFVSRYLSMIEALSMNKEVIAVYDNPIKKDYLLMSPFKKYVQVFEKSDEIANFILSRLKKNELSKNIEAASWAKSQTWGKVANTYLSLWKMK
jgi:glycosyltransferase involved in cell wall biosynthesis